MKVERDQPLCTPSISTVLAILCTTVLLLGLPRPVAGDSGHGHGQKQDSGIPSGYQAGVLTANHGSVLEINGTSYRLDADAEVTDDEGNAQDPAIIRPGDKLWFHLEKRQIDRIIWIMPR